MDKDWGSGNEISRTTPLGPLDPMDTRHQRKDVCLYLLIRQNRAKEAEGDVSRRE